jgi:hypothetical protein
MTLRSGNSRAAKMTPMNILEIREKYAAGRTQGSLAREFGISVGQIGRIVRNESWQQFTPVTTEHDLRIRGAMEHQALKQTEMTPEIQASAEAALARLEGQVERPADPWAAAKAKAPSLYNDPPPTEAEDSEAAERANRLLNRTKLEIPLKISDELGKLEKGN